MNMCGAPQIPFFITPYESFIGILINHEKKFTKWNILLRYLQFSISFFDFKNSLTAVMEEETWNVSNQRRSLDDNLYARKNVGEDGEG